MRIRSRNDVRLGSEGAASQRGATNGGVAGGEDTVGVGTQATGASNCETALLGTTTGDDFGGAHALGAFAHLILADFFTRLFGGESINGSGAAIESEGEAFECHGVEEPVSVGTLGRAKGAHDLRGVTRVLGLGTAVTFEVAVIPSGTKFGGTAPLGLVASIHEGSNSVTDALEIHLTGGFTFLSGEEVVAGTVASVELERFAATGLRIEVVSHNSQG